MDIQERLYKFFAKFYSGKDVSDDEYGEIHNAIQRADEADLGKVEDLLSLFDDPALQRRAADKQKAERFKQGIGLALQGYDLSSSIRQINQSEKTLNRLKQPGMPAPMERSQPLQQALQEAKMQRSNIAQSPAVQAVEEQNLDNFYQDREAGRVASSGQAGAYGANTQAAINRRYAANRQMLPEINRMQSQADSRHDNLLRQQQYEEQFLQRDKMDRYRTQLDQYNREVTAAGALGAAGRKNVRTTLGGIGQSVASLAEAYRFGNNPLQRTRIPNEGLVKNPYGLHDESGRFEFNNLYNEHNPSNADTFDPVLDEYSRRVKESLNPRYNPYIA